MTFARIALMIAVLALIFAAAEIATRLLIPSADIACQEAVAGPRGPVLTTIQDFLRPNARGSMVCNVPYRSNSAGFRGPEVSESKPQDVFRIAVGGDSFTMGSGVPEEGTYAYQLEVLLNQRASSARRFQTLNLGIAGLSIRQVVTRIEQVGLRFHPDMIVYGWTLNDIEGPHYERLLPWNERLAAYAKLKRSWVSPSEFFNWMRSRLRYIMQDDSTSYRSELAHNYFEVDLAWADFVAELDRLAEIQEREGICAVVFLNPELIELHDEHPFTPVYDHVAKAARDRGLFTVRSIDAFLDFEPMTLWVARANSHPNIRGHQILADTLLSGLEQLPEYCWNP